MASADADMFDRIAAEVVGRGQERLGRSVRLALQLLADAPERSAGHALALEQMRYGAERERRAIRSLGEIAATTRPNVNALLAELDRREAQALRDVAAALARAGTARPSRPALSAAEQELGGLRPRRLGGPREWLDRYDRIPWGGALNGYIAREVLQAIDGTRTGLDIYRLVAAEAREGGAHYYGVVRPDAVLALLRGVERLGLAATR
ncbi:MAG TPA: hypothetical protein VFZ21_13815, partial [Gemmatimonadaceae bacterium]|nr:hypothetical protein [Gemmatimonadaceae bacterium]